MLRRTRLAKGRCLLDVNVLIALMDEDHLHHQTATRWFDTPGLDWGVCAFTEAGFLRVSTSPRAGSHSVEEATDVLGVLADRPGYRYWPITDSWASFTA